MQQAAWAELQERTVTSQSGTCVEEEIGSTFVRAEAFSKEGSSLKQT